MKKAVSIMDIAEALGLSRNTVSKALNGQPVPAATRELVFKKARELNYKSLGKGIATQKSYRILLLSGKVFRNMSFFIPLVDTIETYCLDHNYNFIQYVCKDIKISFEKTAAYIRSLRIDGIVVIECFDPSFVQNLTSLGIPCCFIDYPWQSFECKGKYDLICSSSQKSVCGLVTQLIRERGFTRFSFVGDHRHCLSFQQRYTGMIMALQSAEIRHLPEEDIIESDDEFRYGDILSLKKKIKELHRLPNCFVCCNDFVARKMIVALSELGYSVPKDATVIGYDGAELATKETPTITTFRLDKEFLGQEAVRLVVSRIEHKESPKRMVIVETDLVFGESTQGNDTAAS